MEAQLRRVRRGGERVSVAVQRVDAGNFQVVEIGQIHVRIFRNDR